MPVAIVAQIGVVVVNGPPAGTGVHRNRLDEGARPPQRDIDSNFLNVFDETDEVLIGGATAQIVDVTLSIRPFDDARGRVFRF